jgi:tetratricopeptide (TPR) repeat protein
MRVLCACLVALTAAALARADGPALKEARTRLLRGNYAEAQDQYEKLVKQADDRVPATLGLAQVFQATGRYDEALAALDAARKDHPKNADLLGRRAEVLWQRGRWDDALESAKEALKHDQKQFLAHWVLAQLYRDRGELFKASQENLWFVRAYEKDDLSDPEQLLLVGLAAVERARWDVKLQDQFAFVINQVYPAILKHDKDYWPAWHHTGRIALEKYDNKRADEAFTKALVINPRAAEVLADKGRAALQRMELPEADLLATRALRVNPNLPAALRLRADILLVAGDVTEALKHLEQARTVNPRDEATLARVAACQLLQGKDKDFAATVAAVEQQTLKPSAFYGDLAERLEDRRRFDDAEKYYKQAIKLRPTLATARNQLGILYMRLGKEAEARDTLEKAHAIDKFNVRVFNSLKVLDTLDTYDTIKTEHFVIRFDKKNDKVLAQFMAKYLEDIYADLAKQFEHRPAGPILIEVFHTHDMFSGRIVALPDLHTIGACTGPLVALTSPRETSGLLTKPYNWARVLKHELVHVFNLDQTKNKVPHWFTEGLAVRNEGNPMPPTWHRLLRERVTSGDLLTLDTIQLAFVRPNSIEEWTLAYLQSLQYIEYLNEKYGPQSIRGFLRAFGEGKDNATALREVCNVEKADFEKGYRAHLTKLVEKQQGRAPEKVLTLNELKKAHAADPDNPDLTAKLAERVLGIGDIPEAKRLAKAAREKRKNQPLAAYVLARAALEDAEDKEAAVKEAIKILEEVKDTTDVRVLGLLGKLYQAGKQNAQAAVVYEAARKAEPHETTWLTALAQIYKQTNSPGPLADVLKDLVRLTPDDLAACRTLAQVLSKEGKHAEAEQYARQALEIDVLDRPSQQVLEAALQAQNKMGELQELRKMLEP